MSYIKVAALRSAELFLNHLAGLGVSLPFDETLTSGPDSPLAQPLATSIKPVGNRFAILPMEGWDGETDGMPSELTVRRW